MNFAIRNSLVLAAAFVLGACDSSPHDTSPTGNSPAKAPPAARVLTQGEACVTLLAGQSIPVGTVCTSVAGDSAYVTYSTVDGWMLSEAHLWAGTSLSTLPRNRAGNPQLGLFPFRSTSATPATTKTLALPLALFGLNQAMTSCATVTAMMVAHAVVHKPRPDGSRQTETAYGEGTRLVERGNWATWFGVALACAQDEPKVATEETAFAWGGAFATCFIGSGLVETQRWGWTNGPLVQGEYRFALFAGAGQCDLSKGTRVGDLTVLYRGSTATIAYDMLPGFHLRQTHLHAGSDPLASKVDRRTGAKEYTVAPGQYGSIHDLDGAGADTFVVGGLSGPIHVVAHAVVSSSDW